MVHDLVTLQNAQVIDAVYLTQRSEYGTGTQRPWFGSSWLGLYFATSLIMAALMSPCPRSEAAGAGESMNRRYDQNCFLEAHDAYANPAWDYAKWADCNQDEDLPNLLDDGVRSLDLRPWLVKQVQYGCNPQCFYYNSDGTSGVTLAGLQNDFDFSSIAGEAVVAHHINIWGYTLLVAAGVGSTCDNPNYFEDFGVAVSTVALWMAGHPNEVVTLDIESSVPEFGAYDTELALTNWFSGGGLPGYFLMGTNNVNVGMLPAGEITDGLRPNPDGWWVPMDGLPTLQQLVSANRRAVILPDGVDFGPGGFQTSTSFYDLGVDTCYGGTCLPTDCSGDHSAHWVEADQDHSAINMRDYTLPVFMMQHVGDTPEPAHDDPGCVQSLSTLEAKLADITNSYQRLPTLARMDYAEESDPKSFVSSVNALWGSQPTVTATCSVVPPPGSNYWNNQDVTIGNIWGTVSDGSAMTEVMINTFEGPPITWVGHAIGTSAASVTVSKEGKTVVSFEAIGGPLNGVSDRKKVEVWLDKTPPTIRGAKLDPPANGFGWNNTNTEVSVVASDSLSGIDLNHSELTFNLSQQGSNMVVTGRAVDLAGNVSTLTVSNINIDWTPPVITAAPDRPPNSNGWYNAAVTFQFTVTDDLSGVRSSPSEAHVLADGLNQTVMGEAADYAGNRATVTVSGINLDATPPRVTIAVPTNTAALHTYYGALTLGGSASDNLSGVVSVWWTNSLGGAGQARGTNAWTADNVRLRPGSNVITVIATDAAGNSSSAMLTAVYTPPPVLQAENSGNAVVISWPAVDSDLSLQTSPALGSNSAWTLLNGAVVVGTNLVVTNTATGHGGFFRLIGK